MRLKQLKMTEELRTGVEIVDLQHEEFFKRTNQLMKKYQTSEAFDPEYIDQTLEYIWLYMIEHFGTEEELMREYAFPDFARHKRAHMEFRKEYMATVRRSKSRI